PPAEPAEVPAVASCTVRLCGIRTVARLAGCRPHHRCGRLIHRGAVGRHTNADPTRVDARGRASGWAPRLGHPSKKLPPVHKQPFVTHPAGYARSAPIQPPTDTAVEPGKARAARRPLNPDESAGLAPPPPPMRGLVRCRISLYPRPAIRPSSAHATGQLTADA